MPTEIDDPIMMEVEAEVDTDEDDDEEEDLENEDEDDSDPAVEVLTAVDDDEEDGGEEEEDDEANEVEEQGEEELVDVQGANAEDEEDSADDDDEIMAAAVVVIDDEDEDTSENEEDDEERDVEESLLMVEAVSVEEEEETPVPMKNSKASSVPARKSTPTKKSGATAKRNPPSATKKETAKKRSQSNDKKDKKVVVVRKKKQANGASGSESPKSSAVNALDAVYENVPPQKVAAARDSRAMLMETVPTLPVSIAEAQVRSFGRLCIQSFPSSANSKLKSAATVKQPQTKFNTTSALYPVGFSCDRYEFSPVHGRILKMRCSILDGASVKENQKRGGFEVQSELPDGPVFRIMWGRGVDEDVADDKIDYPFDPFVHSPPIVATGSNEGDALLKEAVKGRRVSRLPEVGMRVKVRFDNEQYFPGVISKVGKPQFFMKGKKKRRRVDVTIQYDDGVVETLSYPDPDLILALPGKSTCISYSLVNLLCIELIFISLFLKVPRTKLVDMESLN